MWTSDSQQFTILRCREGAGDASRYIMTRRASRTLWRAPHKILDARVTSEELREEV